MSRLYMLDTNTVSYILKGKSPAARARLAGLGADEVACISIVTEFELEFGLAKNPNAAGLRRAVQWFLARIQVLPWDPRRPALTGNSACSRKQQGGLWKVWTC